MASRRGFTHIYTGNGKGKTTAALGLTLRASGAKWRVCFIQFLKPDGSSEHTRLRSLPGVTVRCFGRKGFIHSRPSAEDRAWAKKGLAAVHRAIQSKTYQLVVADEILVAQTLGLVSEAEVLSLLVEKRPGLELIVTGRGATPRVIKRADLVTEMRERKHYYQQNVPARRGIEY